MNQNSRIHASGARAHGDSVHGSESHRGVDAPPASCRTEGTPAAEVTQNQPERRIIFAAEQSRGAFAGAAETRTVETIASNPLVEPGMRSRVGRGRWRKCTMKSRVE